MATQKLEPRLTAFIEEQKIRATAARMAAAAVDDVPIEVTISHHETVRAAEGAPEPARLDDLQARVRASQQPILDRLREMRATEPIAHTLTNSVTTSLTPRQLEQIAELDEVDIIRHNALEFVECMHESVAVIEAGDASEDFRADGRNITVAVLDSGVDGNHPALLGKVVDEISTVAEPVVSVSHQISANWAMPLIVTPIAM